MKALKLILLCCICFGSGWALASISSEGSRGKKNIILNSEELNSLRTVQKWMKRKSLSQIKEDGSVVFPYGTCLPHVICAPLQLCSVKLEKKEIVTGVHVGDHRWKISPAVSGSKLEETPYLVIKPSEVGIQTMLIVTTNKRFYQLKLIAQPDKITPLISFSYQQEEEGGGRWKQYYESSAESLNAQSHQELLKEGKRKEEKNCGRKNQSLKLENLDFNYEVVGRRNLRPKQVYNNGIKTFIKMPEDFLSDRAPILLVLDANEKSSLVNYRLIKGCYIVDQVFSKAVLINGVQNSKNTIVIKRV